MNNKLIWKGIDSSTIKGLLICELPPITKPKMRVQETVIDGVDGSIIEELGYESYDKTIKIGLTYDFDIDEIIKYFSGEGEVVFSNEPDKYYKASILNRIDYERLLRFREATVKFRVQPFKYQYQEEKLIAKTGSVEGTKIKITNAKLTQLQIDGRSTQKTRSGKNKLNLLANPSGFNEATAEFKDDILKISSTSTITSPFVTYIIPNLQEGDIVRLNSILLDSTSFIQFGAIINGSPAYFGRTSYSDGKSISSYEYIVPSGLTRLEVLIYAQSTIPTGNVSSRYKNTIITVNEEDMTYEIYGESPSPDYPSEIKSIGTYNEESGKYEVELNVIGKNKFDKNNYVVNSLAYKFDASNLEIGKVYTLSSNLPLNIIKISTDRDNYNSVYFNDSVGFYEYTFTMSKNENIEEGLVQYLMFGVSSGWVTNISQLDGYNIQIEEGTKATKKEDYKRNVLLLELNEPLRSLPNGVKDIAYIKNNKLYVDRYVGSVVFNGSESWGINENTNTVYINLIGIMKQSGTAISSDFKFNYVVLTDLQYNEFTTLAGGGYALWFKNQFSTLEEFKTWLSTHNTQADYELATPIKEDYGELTILQLVDGENYISNSEDANMIIDYIEVLNINNLGNHTSKPIFELEGIGEIDFILNNSNIFSYNFDDDGKVIIDSEKEDAYLALTLKNRNMNGEFPMLNPGENKFTWDGLIKNISVSKKSRWL